MKKRLLSLFLAFVTLLGILPTAALAANTEEEALGEVDIYNGGYELSYLTINGRIRTQDYTYFNYVDAKGQKKEVPAYCVNPNIKGVPQTVGVGESIKYLANERSSDPKVVGIISNGYPHRSLGELKLDNKYQAYYATKMALWCYLLPNWNIANLKVAPGLTGSELDIGNRILAAAKDIYKRGTTYNYMLEPRMTATPDKSAAYSVTVDGKQYKQQVFTIWSETWVYDYDIAVSFADPGSVPQGTRIVDENDQDITAVTTKWTGDGYGGKFKVLYPADSIEGESGSVQLSLTADVAQYAAMYAVCQEKDKYGNLQNYICDLDNSRHMELAAVSSYTGGGEPDPKETALKIVKLEEGTKIPLEGAVFSVYDPEGRKVGSFSTSPDGTVIIPLTLEGHYTVTEEIPPQYHLLSEERTQHADVEYNKVATLTFWNAPYGSIRVQKLSDTGDALNGVTVQIKHIESGEVQTAKTKIGGVAVFDQLQPGGWEVRELAGISGWIADTDTVQTVSVVAGKTSDVTIINKELPGLRIIKYERGTMKAMPNVSFEIFRDAESLGIFQTDEFGEILLTDCKPATYRAEERDTGGDGHVLDTTPQEVELKAGDGIKKLVFFNDRLPGIHLIKVDSSDLSKPIANAKFRFEAVDGSWGPEEYTTSEDGTIDLSKLPADTAYIVTELDCPGYVIDDAQRIIHLDGGEQAQFVFTNSKLPSLHLYNRKGVRETSNQKYEITDIAHEKYPFLHRIRALRDIRPDIKAGDLGGFVESESNLSTELEDNAWIYDDAVVCNNGYADRGAVLRNEAIVCGDGYISHGAVVSGHSRVEDSAYVRGAVLNGHARASGCAVVRCSRESGHPPILSGHCAVYGNVSGDVRLTGSTVIISGEEIYNDTLDTLVISGQNRSVIRHPARDELAPQIPEPQQEKKQRKEVER